MTVYQLLSQYSIYRSVCLRCYVTAVCTKSVVGNNALTYWRILTTNSDPKTNPHLKP